MGCKPGLTREDLRNLVAAHQGDIPAAAQALGIRTPALRQRLLRAGLRREYGWTVPVVAPSAALTDSLAVAVVDMTIENAGLMSVVARQEVVIDHLVQQAEHLAKAAGARDDSPKDFAVRHRRAGRVRFLRALRRLRAAPSPEPA